MRTRRHCSRCLMARSAPRPPAWSSCACFFSPSSPRSGHARSSDSIARQIRRHVRLALQLHRSLAAASLSIVFECT